MCSSKVKFLGASVGTRCKCVNHCFKSFVKCVTVLFLWLEHHYHALHYLGAVNIRSHRVAVVFLIIIWVVCITSPANLAHLLCPLYCTHAICSWLSVYFVLCRSVHWATKLLYFGQCLKIISLFAITPSVCAPDMFYRSDWYVYKNFTGFTDADNGRM